MAHTSNVKCVVENIPQVSHLEKEAQLNKMDLLDDPDEGLSEEERARIDRALVRKLDMKLIPWLSLLYLASYMDRTNIGNAKLDGLQAALHMTNNQFNLTLTIFFLSYALFEPLSNILLKRLRPSVFIPIIMIIWGTCMTVMGLVHDFSGLMAVRWFLGFSECGLFPGVGYLLSCWYKRSEFGVRMAIFFSAAALAGSFGGLLAAAIGTMNGVGGKEGWSWIFIIEGLATIVIAVISFWLICDFPDEATFLSPEDKKRVMRRLVADQQSSAEHEAFKMAYFWASVKDWKTYTSALIFSGYTAIKAQLLSVPPFAAAAILTITVGYIADRTRQRGICNMAVSVLGMIGFSMLLGAESAGTRYVGVFLGAMGIYPAISNTISWASNNTEGVYKRGVTLGFVIGFGNLHGMVSSNIYRGADAPRFYPGHATVLAYLVVLQFGGSVLQYILLRRENTKRQRGERDHWIEGLRHDQIALLGDNRPDFLYTL
ncbi:hypothetical protein CDV55_107053 [Aspergillus turcosus]|nr:hypothetical protein CDV55_107053 [Aspergillus turcosus]